MIAASRGRKVSGGGGKSELRRAVCRITSGTVASRPSGRPVQQKIYRLSRDLRASLQAAEVRVKRCGKSAPRGAVIGRGMVNPTRSKTK